jgi:arylsulfatase A-like enzyme
MSVPIARTATGAIIAVAFILQACATETPGSVHDDGETDKNRPNIVLIVADDLGFSDLGSYGGEIDTPNIDSLAREGVRFTQFYNGARCVPTRASLLTGRYAHEVGLGHMTYDAGEPGYRGTLSRHAPTLAEALKQFDYQTFMVGKWHLAANTNDPSDAGDWPHQRGFDAFFGTLPGHGSYYSPAGLMRDSDFIRPGDDFFYTDAISNAAVDYIGKASRNQEPFFLYVAYTAPHYPLHARPETIQKYADTYSQGWDKLRQKRHARVQELGLTTSDLPPRDEASIPWDQETNKQWQAHRMQVYAAMVDEMDQGVGRILDTIRDAGNEGNTLVIFLSDNGASAEGHLNNTIERNGTPWVSRVIPENAPDGEPVTPGDIPGLELGPPTTYGSYGLRWASVSNTPFRRHKSWLHEGGISTPFIARWPDVITNGGEMTEQIGHIVDLMPTLIDAAGEVPSNDLPGVSLLPVFDGVRLPDRTLFWEHEGNRAVRHGKWKLVSEYPGSWSTVYQYDKKGDWELYDLSVDRGEQNDVAELFPAVVTELADMYSVWARESQVITWDRIDGRQE